MAQDLSNDTRTKCLGNQDLVVENCVYIKLVINTTVWCLRHSRELPSTVNEELVNEIVLVWQNVLSAYMLKNVKLYVKVVRFEMLNHGCPTIKI